MEATQIRQPGKATARTVVQTAIGVILGVGVVVPAAVAIIGQEFERWSTPEAAAVAGTVSALSVAISGAAARIMAIPKVNQWLSHVGLRAEDPYRPEATTTSTTTLWLDNTSTTTMWTSTKPEPVIDEVYPSEPFENPPASTTEVPSPEVHDHSVETGADGIRDDQPQRSAGDPTTTDFPHSNLG